MGQSEYWTLCLVREAGSTETQVRIVSSSDVPKKGEQLRILSISTAKEDIESLRGKFDDKYFTFLWGECFGLRADGSIISFERFSKLIRDITTTVASS